MKFFTISVFAIFLLGIQMISAQTNPPPVFVAVVSRVDFVDEVEALGTLQASENVNLTSTVTERITKINFQDNQRISAGHVLLEMDVAQEQAEFAEEQSRINEARRQVDRLRSLVAQGSASTSSLDVQERNLETGEARIKAIQSRINERRIVAPFDGVVGIRNISVGALVQPGTIITTIDDDSVMKLDFSVPEVYLASLKTGIEVKATASAFPGKVFAGTIASVNSRVDPITRSILARALLSNEQRFLKAGMLMQVQLNKNPRKSLVVPEEAIITVGEESAVMRIQEGDQTFVVRQVVELGARRKGEVEILSGLEEGQQIVTHGTSRVRDGSVVKVQAIDRGDASLVELLNQK